MALILGLCPAAAEEQGVGASPPEVSARQLFEEGVESLQAQDLQEARRRFERVVELQPGQAAAHYYLGMIAVQYREMDEAIRHLERAVELNPGESHPWYLLATAYASYGSLESAEKAYLKTLEVNPDFFNARHDLGLLYLREQDLWKAAEMLESALQRDAGSTKTMLALGIIYLQMKKPERALEYVTRLRESGDQSRASQLERLLSGVARRQETPPVTSDILEPQAPPPPGSQRTPAQKRPQGNPFARQSPPAARASAASDAAETDQPAA